MDYKSKKSTLSGEKSQGSGHESDKPQQKNSMSRVDAGHGGGIIHCPVTKNMKHLLDEFKGLYEDRLRRLQFDTRGGTKEDILQMKVHILQSYVNDLGDQNQVLVQTVEDLEIEANNRDCTIEAKLCTSDQIIHDLEQQRRVLEESVCSLRSENQDLKTDMDSLTNFIQRARHQTHPGRGREDRGRRRGGMKEDRVGEGEGGQREEKRRYEGGQSGGRRGRGEGGEEEV
ncbi:unnamed protein product [Coregonus sp. 'balchen']|nr:unnamed protein product [Coregonus sp. 'balchen']